MEEKNFKCGFVALVGRPNVGKSTLFNSLIRKKISIVSPIPQTTRYQIRGILNFDDAQIIFVDTPGIHRFSQPLVRQLNIVAQKSLEDIDLILYVVDVSRPFGREEQDIMDILVYTKIKIIMALNKIDLGTKYLNDYITFWKDNLKKHNIVDDPIIYYIPISALTSKNVDTLLKVIIENIPESVPYYDKDTITDFPLQFQIADIIREELLKNLKEELPHSIAINILNIQDKGSCVYIEGVIYVSSESQKGIIIGRGANFIKKVGTNSRKNIENLLNKKVYLDLRVKVEKDWYNNTRILKELGYTL